MRACARTCVYVRTRAHLHEFTIPKIWPMADGIDVSSSASTAQPRRRLQVRRSGVHGKGVFAVVDLAAGEALIEYTGEVISWNEALRRFSLLTIGDGMVSQIPALLAAMAAGLIVTRTSETDFRSVATWETVVQRLQGFAEPERFQF